MGKLEIGDLIKDGQIAELKELDATLAALLKTYTVVAIELAKGIKIEVNTPKDLEKLYELYAAQAKKAQDATEQLNETARKQEEILNKTANRIHANIETLEKENAKKREAYNVDKSALAIAMDIIGSRGQNLERLVKLDAELKSVTDAQKKLNDEEKKGSLNANDILKKREELIEKERTLKSAKSELTNILSREEKYAQSSVGSYDQLSHSLELMKRAYKQMTQEEKESSNGRILGAEIQSTDKQLKELSSDMGEFQRNVGNYSSALDGEYSAAIKNALGLNNEFAESLLSMASDSDNGGFFEDLSTKAKSFGNTLLSFLKNPVFLSIAGISGGVAAFKFWYDYNKGLIEASKLTSQFTGLQGEDMKHYRNEVQALSDTYSQDFKETLFATNAVAKQFGIDHSEALKLVKDGFIAGADANGEFLENLKEYPAYFKEAGISASEFIAITTQANQSGIYSDKGIDVIKEGNLRIREMTTATATALDNIGISSKEVLEGLRKGELTTFDVMKKVSEKLNELPKSSSAVGTAIADIFGGPGEDAGLQYIRTLKDISTNLDDVKGKAGKLGEVQEDLLTSQVELANAVADLFDSTGGYFETLTAKGKIFTNDVLKDILNYINQITSSADELGKKRLEDAKIQGEAAAKEDIHWQEQKRAEIERTAKAYIKSGVDETVAYQKAKDEQLAILQRSRKIDKDELDSYIAENKKVNENADNASLWRQMIGSEQTNAEYRDQINKTFNLIEYRTASLASADYKIGFIENIDYKPKPDATSGKTKEQIKAEQDAARKTLKIRRDLEESKIEIMDEGIEKEIAKIGLSYQKRIDAITGNSNSEIALRANLEKQKEKALSRYSEEYNERFEKTNLENRLVSVEKNTKEELGLKMQLLNLEEKAEIKAAETTGADILLIEQKYAKKRLEVTENHAVEKNKKLEEEYATRIVLVNIAMGKELDELTAKYKKGEMNAEKYEKNKAAITRKYMLQQLKTALELAQIMVDMPGLSDEDKLKMKQKVAEAEIALSNAVRDNEVAETEDAAKAHQKWLGEFANSLGTMNDIARDALGDTANIFSGLSTIIEDIVEDGKLSLEGLASAVIDVLGGLNDIVQKSYSARIEKIEEEQDANEEAKEKDIERIENLAETGAISEEEAEARKRAAEEKTAAKNAELDKKKQAMAKKQAVWDKATSIAQAGIATALAITKALPNFILAAIVGAMGAIQVATIAATPIPSYAEGTKDGFHPGGKALVGDAGKREVVMYNGLAWITPDTPMMVDLPRGAKVFPDVDEMETLDWNSPDSEMSFMNHKFMGSKRDIERTTVINDFSRLEQKMDENNRLLAQRIKQQKKYDADRDFELYKLRKL